MKHRAFKTIDTGYLRVFLFMQRACCCNQYIKVINRLAPCRLGCYKPLTIKVFGFADGCVVLNPFIELVFAGYVFEILLNVFARRKTMRPVRVWLKCIAITKRRCIASNTRVTVIAPSASYIAGFLK